MLFQTVPCSFTRKMNVLRTNCRRGITTTLVFDGPFTRQEPIHCLVHMYLIWYFVEGLKCTIAYQCRACWNASVQIYFQLVLMERFRSYSAFGTSPGLLLWKLAQSLDNSQSDLCLSRNLNSVWVGCSYLGILKRNSNLSTVQIVIFRQLSKNRDRLQTHKK